MNITLCLLSAVVLVYVSIIISFLLNVQPRTLIPWKKAVFYIGLICIISINVFLIFNMDTAMYLKLYPLYAQIPVFVVFMLVSGRGMIKTIFVILTAMFLTFPFRSITTFAIHFFNFKNQFWNLPIAIIICFVLCVCVYIWMKPNFNYVMDYFGNLYVIKFCVIPVFYNIAVYYLGKYSIPKDMQMLRILLFVIALSAYFLLMDVFRTTREKQQLQYENDMVSLEIESAKQQLEKMRVSQEQTILYRHDMRHHLSLIERYLADGDIEKIKDYLIGAKEDIDEITPEIFCQNEILNLILSSFTSKAKSAGIILTTDIDLPNSLSISDTEFCTIISNGIENAITAASLITDERAKTVKLSCKIHKDNLLILIKNTFVGEVHMINGLPQSDKDNHGFGVKSIYSVTKKHNGYCSFESANGVFTLRVALPLKNE